MNTATLISLITALLALLGAVLVALFNAFANNKTLEEIERLKADLSEQKAEKDARRDYLYEARKRLYEECEPLFFQQYELSQRGFRRIRSLARTAGGGDLSGRDGWLSVDGYYAQSTMYYLFAPLTTFYLIRQRLTLIDLTLDRKIYFQYTLARILYESFSADFKLARQEPVVDYNPNEATNENIKENSIKYTRQGMVFGRLEATAACLLTEKNGVSRCLSFSEFEKEYSDKNSPIYKHFRLVFEIFKNFHPQAKPVLWRILITQFHIYQAIIKVSESDDETVLNENPLTPIPPENRKVLDWRQSADEASDKIVLVEPFDAAMNYLKSEINIKLKKQST